MKTPKDAIKKRKLMRSPFDLSNQFDELRLLREKVRRLESATGSRKVAADRSRQHVRQK